MLTKRFKAAKAFVFYAKIHFSEQKKVKQTLE